jgi:hypothetical protein
MRQGFLSLVGHSLRNLAPVPYSSTGQRYGGIGAGLFGQPAGMEAQMRAQGANGTLFAIVDRIITSVLPGRMAPVPQGRLRPEEKTAKRSPPTPPST